ncbi:Alpha-esterase [Operophtera brumata]|uniref:Alpha-esterase n=1 Tax=Operophtera brumata TaxID=104452 RepID=A0A0L7LCT1_OPEBR|nr:Alpha-esterase [Operophtera brumata]
MLGISHPGACHGDEMGYLFYFSRLNYRLDDDSTELAVSRRMNKSAVDMEWLPVNGTSQVNYLDITGNFTLRTDPETKRMSFWDWLYENYVAKP